MAEVARLIGQARSGTVHCLHHVRSAGKELCSRAGKRRRRAALGRRNIQTHHAEIGHEVGC
jgi:hypothetical protein